MAKLFQGKQIIKILCRFFGFVIVSQKGSHIKLQKKEGHKTITTIVPLHREVALGTLKGILELAQISEKDFRHKAL